MDPDGRDIKKPKYLESQNSTAITNLNMGKTVTGKRKSLDEPVFSRNTIGWYGCLFTAVYNIGNDLRNQKLAKHIPINTKTGNAQFSYYANFDKYFKFTDYVWNTKDEYYDCDANMDIDSMKLLISDISGIDINKIKITYLAGSSKIAAELYKHGNK